MKSEYCHHAAFILAKKFDIDISTARKLKAGEITLDDARKKPEKKKEKKDSEV